MLLVLRWEAGWKLGKEVSTIFFAQEYVSAELSIYPLLSS